VSGQFHDLRGLIIDRTGRPINNWFNIILECDLNMVRGSFIAKEISQARRSVLYAHFWKSSATNSKHNIS
ncbi:hypothetical protein, partial [Vibrio parahaemolyticus]|uniref:hypothetical protein n=1 Tax=Vibrio parahaemolyticus TaxID=670 RepID=UPI002112B153